MAHVIEGDKIPVAESPARLLDRFNLLGSRFLFRQHCYPLPHLARIVAPHYVVAKRLAHEFGARAVLMLADALKLPRHRRRKRNRKRRRGAAHV
jgi:hypothetical protein